VATIRIQKYALFLADYNYSIQYVISASNPSADALSKLAISHKNDIKMDIPTIHFVTIILNV